MTTIPAKELVAVNPSVLTAGGSALDITGLMLTTSTRPPIGAVPSFPDAQSVEDFFGQNSLEATLAGIYFAGFEGSNKLPAALLFAQYPTAPVAAYLRGADASAIPIATLQTFNALINVTIDGVLKTATVNLAAATSFSNAANIIAEALAIDGPTAASVTGSMGASFTGTGSGTNLTVTGVTGVIHPGPDCVVTGTGVPGGTNIVSQTSGTTGGAGVYVTNNATTSAGASLTCVSGTLDVTAVSTGAVGVGENISGSGVTAETTITAFGTGTGGTGTYTTDTPQHFASTTVTVKNPGMIYDSVTGAFVVTSGTTGASSTISYASGPLAADLLLTQAAGATLSQGAIAAVPASFMNGVTAVTTNWVNFTTIFDPDGGSGSTVKQAFAAWKDTQNNRYGYVTGDTDVTPTNTLPAASSLGQILANNGDSGTCLIWDPTFSTDAAFVMGAAASIDFTQTAGRISFAYKSQPGLEAQVVDATAANNLAGSPQGATRGNGYNFYGAYGAANANFVWLQRGFCTGPFAWFDSYVNQIWLNNSFQLALLNLLKTAKSIPYSPAGDGLIEAALTDPIQAGLNFGAFAPGAISAEQAASVNAAAGANVAQTLQAQGFYLQIKPSSSATRAARSSPPINFWYLDRGSVQAISLASIALQ